MLGHLSWKGERSSQLADFRKTASCIWVGAQDEHPLTLSFETDREREMGFLLHLLLLLFKLNNVFSRGKGKNAWVGGTTSPLQEGGTGLGGTHLCKAGECVR